MPWALAISVGLRFSMSTASTTYRSSPIRAPPFGRGPACLETSVHFVLNSHTSAPAIPSISAHPYSIDVGLVVLKPVIEVVAVHEEGEDVVRGVGFIRRARQGR